MRDKANELISMCECGCLDPMKVLTNLLTNYMSTDDADDFAEREYEIGENDDDNN